MSRILQNTISTLRTRTRSESEEIVAAIDLLRESEQYRQNDEPRNCLAYLNAAEATLAKMGVIGAPKPGTRASTPDNAALMQRFRSLTRACRKELRDSAAQDRALTPDKYVILAFVAIFAILSLVVAIPYAWTHGKVSMVRTQAYWVHYPRGLSRSIFGVCLNASGRGLARNKGKGL